MGKLRVRSYLARALFVLLIMVGAVVAAVLDVEDIDEAMASGRYGLGVVAAVPMPAAPAIAASAVAWHETVVARLSRLLRKGRAAASG